MTAHRVTRALVLIVVLVSLAVPVAAQDPDPRATLAVADIDLKPGGWTLPPPEMGAAVAELLLAELVASGRYRVFDGQWLVPEGEGGRRLSLDRLREQALASHVRYIVLGSITRFASERTSRSGAAIIPGPLAIGGFSRRGTATTVGITIKLVDARTGEIVATAIGNGRGSRTARRLGLLGLALPFGAGGGRSSQARDAMVGEAMRQAVHGAVADLVKFAPRLATAEDAR